MLAHAYYPYEFDHYGGDVHFDEDENWTPGGSRAPGADHSAVDFFTVAVHEIGHALGLSHSPDVGSIMFPYYKGSEAMDDFVLGYDDVLAMYELYSKCQCNVPSAENEMPESCTNSTRKISQC